MYPVQQVLTTQQLAFKHNNIHLNTAVCICPNPQLPTLVRSCQGSRTFCQQLSIANPLLYGQRKCQSSPPTRKANPIVTLPRRLCLNPLIMAPKNPRSSPRNLATLTRKPRTNSESQPPSSVFPRGIFSLTTVSNRKKAAAAVMASGICVASAGRCF